ncbi:MAG: hypothetical protein ACOYLN_16370, partial [Blastocatellia bacterium]
MIWRVHLVRSRDPACTRSGARIAVLDSDLTLLMTVTDRTMRILCAIIAKAMIEIVLFAGIASYVAWENFHPLVRGSLDLVGVDQISGWAADPGSGE